MKSYKFKNCGQILCTHKSYFLMSGHKVILSVGYIEIL